MNTVAVTADSKAEMIEVALIQVSPDNPRKTFDQKALEELAASIATEGVKVPLLIRIFATDNFADSCAGIGQKLNQVRTVLVPLLIALVSVGLTNGHNQLFELFQTRHRNLLGNHPPAFDAFSWIGENQTAI